MNAQDVSIDTSDIEKTIGMLNRVGVSPQKAINKGTSKAALMLKRHVRSEAPVGKPPHGGTLRKNIVVRAESNRGRKGRKVREVTFKGGKEANALLQRPIKEPGALGGKYPKAYYPASQEYGFLARAKGGGVQYIPGKYFMRDAADSHGDEAKELMTDTVMKELEKIWQEKTQTG